MDYEANDASHVHKRNSVCHLYDADFRQYPSRNIQFNYLHRINAENASADEDDAIGVETEGRKLEEEGQLQQKDLLININFSTESAGLSLSPPTATLEIGKAKQGEKQITRDDWNEVATLALLDAWSKKCKQLNKFNLKLEHWADLADTVTIKSSNRKSDVQCKNRVDTLKKKYKLEKKKQAYGCISKWPYFYLLDKMLKTNSQPDDLRRTVDAGKMNKADIHHHMVSPSHTLASSISKGTHKMISSSANGDDEAKYCDEDTSRKQMSKDASSTAALKFGEIFEKFEKRKHLQIKDLEITRKKFTKDLEQKRIQLFMQAQKELTKLMKRGTWKRQESQDV